MSVENISTVKLFMYSTELTKNSYPYIVIGLLKKICTFIHNRQFDEETRKRLSLAPNYFDTPQLRTQLPTYNFYRVPTHTGKMREVFPVREF